MLFLTGYYPVLAYLAYICVGLAIGRCDLSSALVARRLLLGGIAGSHDVFLHSSARFGAAVESACDAVCTDLTAVAAVSA